MDRYERVERIAGWLLVAWLVILAASVLKTWARDLRGPVGWTALGVALGAVGMLAAHVACPSCQGRAAAWRRALGLRLVE